MNKSVILSPAERMAAIRKKLGHFDVEWAPTQYLKTGHEWLDSVFGADDLGIPFGKMIELSGLESHGKSAIGFDLVAAAQKAKAECHWIDAENSFTAKWAETRGVDTSRLYLHTPYIGKFGKEKTPRLITAQELCEEAETIIMENYRRRPNRSRLAVLDSVTALLTREEAEAGIVKQNMRTKLSLAAFLNQLLRRWVAMCQSTNTTILFINQIRIDPTTLFGSPEYTPGGKALKFYCHVRVKIRRAKGGKLMKAGKQVGIKGIATNFKNKVGGEEGTKCGYRLYWKSGKSMYIDPKKIERDE